MFWSKVRDQLSLSTYLLSGAISGVVLGLIVQFIYHLQGNSWIIFPFVAMSASFFLFIFAKFDLYQNPFFQLFSTITLGISTGLFSFIMIELLEFILPSRLLILSLGENLILDMIIYGFLLNFAYAFSGRILAKKRPRKNSE